MLRFANTTPGNLLRRCLQLVVGLSFYGVAAPLMIRSGLGLGPWDAFHVGLHNLTGLTVGQATIVVGLVILAGGFALGVRPGPGTPANMILIGIFVDLVLPRVPEAEGLAIGLVYYGFGIVLAGLSTGMYMGAMLGTGPRDGLIMGLSRRTGRSVRSVRTVVELFALTGGWAMGSPLGIGTVLFAVLIGPVAQFFIHFFLPVAKGEKAGAAAVPDFSPAG